MPRSLAVRGVADASANVTVDGQSVAGRAGDYFYGETTVDDDLAHWLAVEVEGRLSGGGYQGSDRVAREIDEQFIAANPENFVHDADGNLLRDGRFHYTWNAENRLTKVETLPAVAVVGYPKIRLTFQYDYQGRRFAKTVERWNTETNAYQTQKSLHFLYDGWNLIAELSHNSSLILQNSSFYTWGLDLSGTLQGAGGVGGLLSVTNTDGQTYAPHYDGNGNIMGYVDAANGTAVAEFEYGPFGETIKEIYTSGNLADTLTFKFSTKYQDSETGLYYYGFRYYNTKAGRWLSRDPIGQEGGLNLYGFVGNDGLTYIDLLGEQGCNPVTGRGCRNKPSNHRTDSGSFGIPDLVGIYGSVAYYVPLPSFPAVGGYLKLSCQGKKGKCCERGSEKTYIKTKCRIEGGVYAGSPGLKLRTGVPFPAPRLDKCPDEYGPELESGTITASGRLTILKISCTLEPPRKGLMPDFFIFGHFCIGA